jgi:hypothetical protein
MRATLAAALPIVLPGVLWGQSVAATYLERYHDVMTLGSSGVQFATVDHLVLTRDAGQLTLEQGMLYLLAPIGGRTVGAVFQGQGRFTFAPTLPVEHAEPTSPTRRNLTAHSWKRFSSLPTRPPINFVD